MRFSASRLKTWGDCQLQGSFKYLDNLPSLTHAKSAFGSVIHAALETYDRTGDLEVAKDRFRDLWQNPEKIGVTIDFWPKHGRITHGGLRQKGLEVLQAYHDRWHFDSKRELVALEHPFLVPFGRHELTGFVDKLEIRKTAKAKTILAVVDHKSNARKPTVAELALNIQFTIYIFASMQPEFWVGNGPEFPGIPNGEWLFDTSKDLPRRAIWHHLMTGQEIDAGGRDNEEFARLYRLCNEVQRAIELKVFVPSISGETCGICSYANGPCPTRVPTAEELLEDADAWL